MDTNIAQLTKGFQLSQTLQDLQKRHQLIFERDYLSYFAGCRLKILIVADRFLYFDDSNFGLSEVVTTLRGLSTTRYPVTVDLAHRGNPGASRLNGATPDFTFEYDALKQYHQIWIMAAETRFSAPISDDERQAIRRFMDEGGGVFATGDHEDLGVSVGGYIPRVRSMRKWFWPGPGPNGEPVAPHGSDATRHDTNRAGRDPGFSFDDQSDDIPQTITPRYFGGLVQSVHPLLCSPTGPIRVLPDHPHEGECMLPDNLKALYQIGDDTFQEYPDGADGSPLAPVIVATARTIPGAEVPEGIFPKPPVEGKTFDVIAAWDGHRAAGKKYGRIVVDATWHHFININLVGDRNGMPDPSDPKSMGFLYSATGLAHYEDIKTYFTNIANWLTPTFMRRCFLHRRLWWLVNQGELLENLRVNDPIYTGRLGFEILKLLGPCERYGFIQDLFFDREIPLESILDPFIDRTGEIDKLAAELGEEETKLLAQDIPAAFMGAAIIEFLEEGMSVERLKKEFGDDEPEIPALTEAAKRAVDRGFKVAQARLELQSKSRNRLLETMR